MRASSRPLPLWVPLAVGWFLLAKSVPLIVEGPDRRPGRFWLGMMLFPSALIAIFAATKSLSDARRRRFWWPLIGR